MLFDSIILVIALGLLVWSAGRFIDGAAGLAGCFGVSPLVIGMVIVGFGTSAPEMVVSASAALQQNPELAMGNAYGSNIANIGLVLGITALLCPVVIHSGIFRKELPILMAITIFAGWQLSNGLLSRGDAMVLLGLMLALGLWTFWQARWQKNDALAAEFEKELKLDMTPGRAALWTIIGLVALVGSSQLLVLSASNIAIALGVSKLVVGLTVVAVGTSLPELASSIAAVRKGQDDIAIGNIIGSNIFNTLAVVGIAGVICPFDVPGKVLVRDIGTMGFMTVLLFVFCVNSGRKQGKVSRVEGLILLLCYAGYWVWVLATGKMG